MKKTLFALMAFALVFAIALTSCKKEEEKKDEPKPPPPVEKTVEDLLIQEKGWVLVSATSSPAFINKDGVEDVNLFNNFFLPCELDDILVFYKNKSSFMKFGEEICEDQEGTEISLGNWKLTDKDKVLEFYLPYFFDDEDNFVSIKADIIVSESILTLKINIDYDNGEDEPETKAVKAKIVNNRGMKGVKSEINYDFTLTYKVAN